ncbi:hypothetical protein Tco_1538231 [Tanacetum coccineum]
MKKEGRQHSAVRTFPLFPTPLSQQRNVKNVDSASVTRVLRKPTNQPKFMGKCGTPPRYADYHIYTASKSSDKAKGNMKSMSISYDHRMIECPSGASTADALASYISIRVEIPIDFPFTKDQMNSSPPSIPF